MKLKGYDAVKYSKRYREYKLSFLILCFLFIFSIMAGVLLWSKISLTAFGEQLYNTLSKDVLLSSKRGVFAGCLKVFAASCPGLLVIFAAGITVYAPAVSGFSVALRGISCGVSVGYLSRMVSEGLGFKVIIADLLFCFFGAFFMCMGGAFAVCVSLKQFGAIADTDEKLFGGTLFCGNFFKNKINLRFLFFYILAFFIIILCQFTLSLAYSWIINMVL